MKRPSLDFFLAGGCLLLFGLGGCATRSTVVVEEVVSQPLYARVVVADFRARPIAEYIAEGEVRKTSEGYAFRAVERRIFSPQPLRFRYPLGRPVTVSGSNVLVTPAAKPEWLVRTDVE
ncbi:MAG TPA: hypothetical protein VNQ90_00365 [Chthoniobacteraceae bacterium]|nr:hypothetical protein [Chthoniobacteraceae bacterium]